ncbi:MAG TPA: YraN family protein [Actinocrinis sp.]
MRGRRMRLKREKLRRQQEQAGRQSREDRETREGRETWQRDRLGEPDPGAERTWGHWLGRYGEQAAARYLVAAGYRLLDRNWVCRDPDLRGELDLVARYRRTVVACEVKTRAGDTLDNPAQAVTAQKAQRLRLLAVRWLAEQRAGTGGGFNGAFGPGRGTGPSHRRVQIPLSRSGDGGDPRDPSAGGPGLRIDVIAVRTDPRPPFAVRSLDHLIGVA